MTGKTHLVGGILVASVAIINGEYMENLDKAIFMGMTIIGSLFPDIDHGRSYIGQKAKITSKVVSKTCGHRGATHSPIMTLLFLMLLDYLNNEFLIVADIKILLRPFYLGIASHIFLDFLTGGGVPIFMPFSKKRYSLTNFKTAGEFESIVFSIMMIYIVYLLIDRL